MNLYGYAHNDPINFLDRFGLYDYSAAQTSYILNAAVVEYQDINAVAAPFVFAADVDLCG